MIAVSVVVCVVLVVIFFGGCGLYFGLRKTRKSSANFDSPNQSFDKIPQYVGSCVYAACLIVFFIAELLMDIHIHHHLQGLHHQEDHVYHVKYVLIHSH